MSEMFDSKKQSQGVNASASGNMMTIVLWILKFVVVPITGTIAIVKIVKSRDFGGKNIFTIVLYAVLFAAWLAILFVFVIPAIRG